MLWCVMIQNESISVCTTYMHASQQHINLDVIKENSAGWAGSIVVPAVFFCSTSFFTKAALHLVL